MDGAPTVSATGAQRAVQGFYMFVRAVQLLTQRNDGTIVVRRVSPTPHFL
jgi:hypothetical protein